MAHGLPQRGRPGLVLMLKIKRDLTHEDLLRRKLGQGPKMSVPVLQCLKARHHSIARLIASGKSVRETASLTNITPQRVSQLNSDPLFLDLVAYYQEQINEASLDATIQAQVKLTEIHNASLDEISDRLDDDDKRKEIPIGELRQLAIMGLDRTVAPPRNSQPVVQPPTKITFNIGNRDLRPKIEDVEFEEIKEN